MNWPEISSELINVLRLKTDPLAFRRLEKESDLEKIKNVQRMPHMFTFCQAVFLSRVQKMTIGMTMHDKMMPRCMRLHGVSEASEEKMQAEARSLAKTWFATPEEAYRQQVAYPRVPVAEAVVLSPLAKGKIEPEIIIVFGNPAQLMMLLCGLQKERYERFDFHFIGEGACSDSLGECFRTGKPQLSISCYGERAMGQVSDDEISLALPSAEITRAISGIKKLAQVGLKYPINFCRRGEGIWSRCCSKRIRR